jgi:hypothetical protein
VGLVYPQVVLVVVQLCEVVVLVVDFLVVVELVQVQDVLPVLVLYVLPHVVVDELLVLPQ